MLLHDHIFLWQGHVNSRCKGLKSTYYKFENAGYVINNEQHTQDSISLMPSIFFNNLLKEVSSNPCVVSTVNTEKKNHNC